MCDLKSTPVKELRLDKKVLLNKFYNIQLKLDEGKLIIDRFYLNPNYDSAIYDPREDPPDEILELVETVDTLKKEKDQIIKQLNEIDKQINDMP